MTENTVLTSNMISNSLKYLTDNSHITDSIQAFERYNAPLMYELKLIDQTNFEVIPEMKKLPDRQSRQDFYNRMSVKSWLSEEVRTLDDLLLENDDYIMMMANKTNYYTKTMEKCLTCFTVFCLGCNSRAIRLYWIITLRKQLRSVFINNSNMQNTYKSSYQLYIALNELLKKIQPKTITEFFVNCEKWWSDLSSSGSEYWVLISASDFFLQISIPNVLNLTNGSVIFCFMSQVEREVSDILLDAVKIRNDLNYNITQFTFDVEITGADVEIVDKRIIMYNVPLPLRPFFLSLLTLRKSSPYYNYLALCLMATGGYGYNCNYPDAYDDLSKLFQHVKPFNPSDFEKVTTIGQFAIHCLTYNLVVPETQFSRLQNDNKWLRLVSVLHESSQFSINYGSKLEAKLIENQIPVYFTGDREDNMSYERLRSSNKLSQFLDIYKLNIQVNSYKSFLTNFFIDISCDNRIVVISVKRREQRIPFISYQRASGLKELLDILRKYDLRIPKDVNGLKYKSLSYTLVEFLEYFRNSSYSWLFPEASYAQLIEKSDKKLAVTNSHDMMRIMRSQINESLNTGVNGLFDHAFDEDADVIDETALFDMEDDFIYEEEEDEVRFKEDSFKCLQTQELKMTSINNEDIQIKGIAYRTEMTTLELEAKPIYRGVVSHLQPVSLRELSTKQLSVNNGEISVRGISYSNVKKPKSKLAMTEKMFLHKSRTSKLSDYSRLIYTSKFMMYLGKSLKHKASEVYNLDNLLLMITKGRDPELASNYGLNAQDFNNLVGFIMLTVGDPRYREGIQVKPLNSRIMSWFITSLFESRYTTKSELIIRLMCLLRVTPEGRQTNSSLYLHTSVLRLLLLLYDDKEHVEIESEKMFKDLLICMFSSELEKLDIQSLHLIEHLPTDADIPNHYIIAQNIVIGPDVIYQDDSIDVLTTLSSMRFQDLPIDSIYFGKSYTLVVVKRIGYLLLTERDNTGWTSYINFPIIERVYAVVSTDLRAILDRYRPNYVYDVIWLAEMTEDPVVIRNKKSKLQGAYVNTREYKIDQFSIKFDMSSPKELNVDVGIRIGIKRSTGWETKSMKESINMEADESMFHTICKILIAIAFKLLYNIDCQCSYNNGKKILDLAFIGDITYVQNGLNVIQKFNKHLTIEVKTSKSYFALQSMCSSGNALQSDILFGIYYNQNDAINDQLSLNSFKVIRRYEEQTYSKEVAQLLKLMLVRFSNTYPGFSSLLAKNSSSISSVLSSKSQFKFNDMNGLFEIRNSYETEDQPSTKLKLVEHVSMLPKDIRRERENRKLETKIKLSKEDKEMANLLKAAYGPNANNSLRIEFDDLNNRLQHEIVSNDEWDDIISNMKTEYLDMKNMTPNEQSAEGDASNRGELLLKLCERRD